jgi:hypothetical protein
MTSGEGKVRLLPTIGFVMCLFLAETAVNVSFAQEISVTPLTSDQVVQRMVERNEQRAQALESYRGTRIYNLEYRGLASKSATLVTSPSFCTSSTERVYITALGCEICFGTQGLQAAGAGGL